jgi:hypothetical protein
VKLNPSLLEPTADWFVWGFGLLLVLSPAIVALLHRKMTEDPVIVLTFLVFPLLSLVTMSFSYYVGATLLLGSGFLAVYTLVSRSPSLLDIESGSALRVVSAVVFGLLALVAAGGVVSVLVWRQDFFLALVSGSSLEPMDVWLSLLAFDLSAFYLVRPLLTAIFIMLTGAGIVALFREPLQWLATPFSRLLGRILRRNEEHAHPNPSSTYGTEIALEKLPPYVALLGSLALGVAICVYPYVVADFRGVLGVDSWFYIKNLNSINDLRDAIPLLQTPRTFFFILLFLVKILTGLSAEWVVRLMPCLLSALLALSTFVLVREGTDRPWVAAFASLLSVVSAQTALGMSAGIINNWFALSMANFMFALIVRSIRLKSKTASIEAFVVSLVLLASYAFLWIVVTAELTLVLAASVFAFRGGDRNERKYEIGLLGAVLSASILIPMALLYVTAQLLGFGAQGIDTGFWFTLAWRCLTRVQPQLLGSVLGVFEEAFDFAGNRIDLPLLTLLSVVGLLDHRFQRRSFNRIMAATIFVPIVLTVIISASSASPDTPMWLTWRGLYIIPLYLTGALGVESIIRRVNGSVSLWRSPSRLAFAGTFVAYLFLSHLSYSLRALELLLIVARAS